jgi:sigma-B regulation protein RsbU (phosphoserine phosphatase)
MLFNINRFEFWYLGNVKPSQNAPSSTFSNTKSSHNMKIFREESHPQTWQTRLHEIVETMRELSSQTNPQEMVRNYGRRIRQMFPADKFISLSRRDLTFPEVRITRFSGWTEEINPWREQHKLPMINGGILSQLIYEGNPTIIKDLEIDEDDPAYPFIGDQKSLRAIPLFDQGESLNMVIATKLSPNSFNEEQLPELTLVSNLFGRATHNLVLAEQLSEAFKALDREIKIVSEIQQQLLPAKVPDIPTLALAAYYQPSNRASGDYYDFFPLANGRWGILIADVSGHGTPAAVVMAITRSIAHTYSHETNSPGQLLNYINNHLVRQYTGKSGAFVTAFYGVYDPARRRFTYSSAGHNPPRLKRCGENRVILLDKAGRIPMGIAEDISYDETTITCVRGDRIILYTDGIVESTNPQDTLYGTDRMDELVKDCNTQGPEHIINLILSDLNEFCAGTIPNDDRTIVVMEITE